MIWHDGMEVELEGNEPVLRSCPKCNPAHEHLLKTKVLHMCFECGIHWVSGVYLDGKDSEEEFIKKMEKIGLKTGDSTMT